MGDNWEALVNNILRSRSSLKVWGNPAAAVTHILSAFDQGKHVINARVEADAFCGPSFSFKAHEAGVIYSIAYGGQPGLAADLVD